MKEILFQYFILFFLIIYSNTIFSEELEIGISQGNVKPTPIAVTDFFSKDLQSTKIGKNISDVISQNLQRSGLFIPKEISSKITRSPKDLLTCSTDK